MGILKIVAPLAQNNMFCLEGGPLVSFSGGFSGQRFQSDVFVCCVIFGAPGPPLATLRARVSGIVLFNDVLMNSGTLGGEGSTAADNPPRRR